MRYRRGSRSGERRPPHRRCWMHNDNRVRTNSVIKSCNARNSMQGAASHGSVKGQLSHGDAGGAQVLPVVFAPALHQELPQAGDVLCMRGGSTCQLGMPPGAQEQRLACPALQATHMWPQARQPHPGWPRCLDGPARGPTEARWGACKACAAAAGREEGKEQVCSRGAGRLGKPQAAALMLTGSPLVSPPGPTVCWAAAQTPAPLATPAPLCRAPRQSPHQAAPAAERVSVLTHGGQQGLPWRCGEFHSRTVCRRGLWQHPREPFVHHRALTCMTSSGQAIRGTSL